MAVQAEINAVYEGPEDALCAAVAVLGGPKAVAVRLWPGKGCDAARSELLDALNPDRPRKLDQDEVLSILRWAGEVGFHSAKHYFDHAAGYQPSMPIERVAEQARVLRHLTTEIVTLQARLAAAMDALGVDATLPEHLRRVK